jgi:GNAT superfamily N-acetyltransferase
MTVREALPADADALLPLATEHAASFAIDPNCFRESFRQSWLDSSSHVFVAIVKSSLVGYILGFDYVTFLANGRVAQVEEIYVRPLQRGHGVGRALMKEFERWAESRGSVQVVACTRQASGFYSALGYEETTTCFRKILEKKAEQPTRMRFW